jgi:hypothetical protein
MCDFIITSAFKDFSNKPIEKSLSVSFWSENKYQELNCNNDNIIIINVNENLISLTIESKTELNTNLNEIKFVFNDHVTIRLYEIVSLTRFNYEYKTKYVINYKFLEWDDND